MFSLFVSLFKLMLPQKHPCKSANGALEVLRNLFPRLVGTHSLAEFSVFGLRIHIHKGKCIFLINKILPFSKRLVNCQNDLADIFAAFKYCVRFRCLLNGQNLVY